MPTPLGRSPIALRRLVEERAQRLEVSIGGEYLYTHALAFHPSGRWLVTARHGALIVIDVVERRVEALDAHRQTLSSIAFDRAGERLVSVGWDGAVCVWDFAARTFVRFEVTKHRLHAVAITADGKTAYTVGHEAVLTGIDLQTGKRIVSSPGHHLYCSAVGISRDDSLLLSSDSGGGVRVWDRSGQCLRSIDQSHAGNDPIPYWPVSIRFRERGDVLFACRIGSAALFDPTSGRVLRTFAAGHPKSVTDAITLEDAGLLLTSSEDATVSVWDANSSEGDGLLFTFKPHTKTVLALAVAPDGRTFATVGSEGVAKVWDVQTVAMAARDPAKLTAIGKATCAACGARLTFVEDVDQLACEACGGMYDFASVAKRRGGRAIVG